MKTSVEISDALFAQARRLAERESRSLRALIEEGLRLVVGARRSRKGRFRLRRATFRGKDLQPDLGPGTWEEIRRRAYEGRGG